MEGGDKTIEQLKAAGDAEQLVALGDFYRSGGTEEERDLKKAYACFAAAADLGHPQATYRIGVFHFWGNVVPQDLVKAVSNFRIAANQGHLKAKVYVANLYELGIYYQRDTEKADLWYRNVARSLELAATPESDEYTKTMAAEGCVRYCLLRIETETLSQAEKNKILAQARAFGYEHKQRNHQRRDAEVRPAPVTVAPPVANRPSAPMTMTMQPAEPAAAVPGRPSQERIESVVSGAAELEELVRAEPPVPQLARRQLAREQLARLESEQAAPAVPGSATTTATPAPAGGRSPARQREPTPGQRQQALAASPRKPSVVGSWARGLIVAGAGAGWGFLLFRLVELLEHSFHVFPDFAGKAALLRALLMTGFAIVPTLALCERRAAALGVLAAIASAVGGYFLFDSFALPRVADPISQALVFAISAFAVAYAIASFFPARETGEQE
ncbi:MAG: SEL1-like repeat protein [Candidatus Schekmanbacteria bacterium]|nr:SEL1-like repeat protein [Candidatus Schekmanbacteria bacterium]